MKKPPANATPDNPEPEEEVDWRKKAALKRHKMFEQSKPKVGTFHCIKCGTDKPIEEMVEMVQPTRPRGYCRKCMKQ